MSRAWQHYMYYDTPPSQRLHRHAAIATPPSPRCHTPSSLHDHAIWPWLLLWARCGIFACVVCSISSEHTNARHTLAYYFGFDTRVTVVRESAATNSLGFKCGCPRNFPAALRFCINPLNCKRKCNLLHCFTHTPLASLKGAFLLCITSARALEILYGGRCSVCEKKVPTPVPIVHNVASEPIGIHLGTPIPSRLGQ